MKLYVYYYWREIACKTTTYKFISANFAASYLCIFFVDILF